MVPSYLDARSFGVVADGVTDDGPALQTWINACIVQSKPGLLPPGVSFSSIPLVKDLSATSTGTPGQGVALYGSAPLISAIKFADGVSTPCFKIKSVPGNNTFGWELANLSIVGNSDGPIVQIGEDDFSDEHNDFLFRVWIINYCQQASALGVRLNAVFHASLAIVANCGGKGTGSAAAEFRGVQFSDVRGSFGNSAVGLRFQDGHVFANVFDAVNLEESDINLVISSPHANRNIFDGGTFNWDVAAINATAGNYNRFVATNWAAGSPPTMMNNVGVIIDEFLPIRDWYNNGKTARAELTSSGDLYLNNNNDGRNIHHVVTGAGSHNIWSNNVRRSHVDGLGNNVLGAGMLATDATDGFPYIPMCDGPPTGIPTAKPGLAPVIVDRVNKKFCVYLDRWRSVDLT